MAVVYSTEQLHRLHEIEIEILTEIDRVCKELNIQYFADWGTLLGAVRHKGFIPWDDDVDICMMREDYELFIKKASVLLADNFVLQHYLIDPGTPTYQAKVRKNGTKFVEDYLKDIPVNQGIFVDIFPYDVVTEDSRKRAAYEKKARFCRRLFVSKTVNVSTVEKNKTKKTLFNVMRKLIKITLLPISKQKLYDMCDAQMRLYENEKSTLLECCANVPQSKDDFYPLMTLDFDGFSMPVPNNWDSILKKEYGNYMQLPPKEKQYTHAPSILDLGK